MARRLKVQSEPGAPKEIRARGFNNPRGKLAPDKQPKGNATGPSKLEILLKLAAEKIPELEKLLATGEGNKREILFLIECYKKIIEEKMPYTTVQKGGMRAYLLEGRVVDPEKEEMDRIIQARESALKKGKQREPDKLDETEVPAEETLEEEAE